MEKRALLIASVLALAACASALPLDVARFVEQREACDHFRGEVPDPPDAERAREIAEQVKALCMGTDQQLAELRKRHSGDTAVMKRLQTFDDAIE